MSPYVRTNPAGMARTLSMIRAVRLLAFMTRLARFRLQSGHS
jgi:hypothetical protein